MTNATLPIDHRTTVSLDKDTASRLKLESLKLDSYQYRLIEAMLNAWQCMPRELRAEIINGNNAIPPRIKAGLRELT